MGFGIAFFAGSLLLSYEAGLHSASQSTAGSNIVNEAQLPHLGATDCHGFEVDVLCLNAGCKWTPCPPGFVCYGGAGTCSESKKPDPPPSQRDCVAFEPKSCLSDPTCEWTDCQPGFVCAGGARTCSKKTGPKPNNTSCVAEVKSICLSKPLCKWKPCPPGFACPGGSGTCSSIFS